MADTLSTNNFTDAAPQGTEGTIALQRMLIANGYLKKGADDGDYGKQTQEAHRKWWQDSAPARERQRNLDLAKSATDLANANAAAEAAKGDAARKTAEAQAGLLKAKADADAANVETGEKAESLRQTKARNAQNEDYRRSIIGQIMEGGPAVGIAGGAYLGHNLAGTIEGRQAQTQAKLNAEREALASRYDTVKPKSPGAIQEYKSIADTAHGAGIMPPGPKTALARRFLPYALTGSLLGLEGGLQRFYLGSDPDKPISSDIFGSTGAGIMGAGFGTLASGTYQALNPSEVPNAEALRKIALAGQTARDLANKPQLPPASLGAAVPQSAAAPVPAPEAPLRLPPVAPAQRPEATPNVPPYVGAPAHVTRNLYTDLGGDPAKAKTKAKMLEALPDLIDGASDEAVSTAARRAGYTATKDPRTALKTFANGALTEKKAIAAIPRIGAIAGPLAAAGLWAEGSQPANAAPQGREESYPHYLARHAFPAAAMAAPELDPRNYEAAGTLGSELARAVRAPGSEPMSQGSVTGMKPHLDTDIPDFSDEEKAHLSLTPQGRQMMHDRTQSRTQLAAARAEDARQRMELEAKLAGGTGSLLTPSAPSSLEAATGFAQGGKVTHQPHIRALKTTLSAMQHELQNALSAAVKQLESFEGKKGADRAVAKVKEHHDNLIEDIWALHGLAQKIMGGHLSVHPRISKKELIEMARQHDRTSAKAA